MKGAFRAFVVLMYSTKHLKCQYGTEILLILKLIGYLETVGVVRVDNYLTVFEMLEDLINVLLLISIFLDHCMVLLLGPMAC